MSEIVPEGWKISQLGNLATVNWGNTTLTKASYVEEGFPAFSAAGNDGLVTNAEHHSTGIVLSAIGARCGRTFLTPEKWTAIKNTIAILTDDQDIRYLYHVFNFDDVWNKSGGAQPFISLGDARKTPILHPPLPEQKKIASILTSVDEVIETTQKQIDKLQDLKKATMNELLTKGIGHTEFKDSELGRIPKTWEVVEISNIKDKIDQYSFTGGPFGSNLKSEDYTQKGVRIIQLQNIGDGQFLNNYKIYTSQEKADELKSCNIFPGDIILSKMGDPVARATMIPDFETRFLMASDGIRLSINKNEYDTKFILESINHFTFRNQAELKSTGSTRKRIGLVELRTLKIAIPPLSEQKKIASILTSKDITIEKRRCKLTQTQSLKKSLMQDLLTGKVRVQVN
ncbi:restriction endonuclease subunit S [Amylibacter sp.]|nr:restriction endonuclease subunit S [Amylibacter sp.]